MTDIDLEALGRVDQVNDLIKRLVKGGENNDKTFRDIDDFLSKKDSKAFDKTVINKSKTPASVDPNEVFFKEIERDAMERTKRKAEAKAKAELIKTKANDYFKACDFEQAVKYYSRAINECKDYDILYTNRAQGYLKLDKINEALADCDMALRISPNNHKAMLHRGRSLVRLNRFDEALVDYTNVLKIAPNLKKYMEEFFQECNKLKTHFEMKQMSAFAFNDCNLKSKDNAISEIIRKLTMKSDERIEFYVGGLELILSMISGNDCDQINQIKNDFKSGSGIFAEEFEVVKKCRNVLSTAFTKIPSLELHLLSVWIQLVKTIIKNDNECIMKMLQDPVSIACVDFCCKWAKSIPITLLCPAISILYQLSNVDIGLQQMFDRFPTHSILSITLCAINLDQKRKIVIVGIDLFHNLVQSQRFKVSLSKDEKLVSSTIDCMHALFTANVKGGSGDLTSVISIIELLADNSTIRMQLLKHDRFLDDCMNAIESRINICDDDSHSSALLQLFTLIHNLLVRSKNCPSTGKVKQHCQRIVMAASRLLSHNPGAEMRNVLLQIISQLLVVLPEDKLTAWCDNCDEMTTSDHENVSMCRSLSRHSSLTDIGYLDKVCRPLKLCITILDTHNHPMLPCAIKILALASKVNQSVRFLCCDVRKRVLKLQSLLYRDKGQLDEVFCGNICLLFINCVNETPLAEHLAKTDIIKDLLHICADANKTDCRRNAAIFAGNLAQSNHLHRNELSRLNGFSIISKFNCWS